MESYFITDQSYSSIPTSPRLSCISAHEGKCETRLTQKRHFPGSSVLYWDRSLSPSPLTSHSSPPSTRPSTPPSSTPLLLVSDTLMVQPHLRGFTFIFSVPNLVPLSPLSTLTISHRLQNIAFGQATSAWPGRFIRKSADRVMRESVGRHLGVMGWKERDGGLVDAREA